MQPSLIGSTLKPVFEVVSTQLSVNSLSKVMFLDNNNCKGCPWTQTGPFTDNLTWLWFCLDSRSCSFSAIVTILLAKKVQEVLPIYIFAFSNGFWTVSGEIGHSGLARQLDQFLNGWSWIWTMSSQMLDTEPYYTLVFASSAVQHACGLQR